ncbi:MAG: sigma-70 family RNA polymerase sigma factor [Planctomycetes bacterium]|nr:sigma-70 family RNA polymerase sigma factor [Planctomycetota bacterium]
MIDIGMITTQKTSEIAGQLTDYAGLIYSISYRVLQNREEAEDATQEVLLSAVNQINKGIKIESLKHWLAKIAVNKSLSRVRDQKVHQKSLIQISRSPNVGPDREKEVALQTVKEFVDELPKDEQIILNLIYVQNFSYSETADITSIPEGSVARKINGAKKKIKERFVTLGLTLPLYDPLTLLKTVDSVPSDVQFNPDIVDMLIQLNKAAPILLISKLKIPVIFCGILCILVLATFILSSHLLDKSKENSYTASANDTEQLSNLLPTNESTSNSDSNNTTTLLSTDTNLSSKCEIHLYLTNDNGTPYSGQADVKIAVEGIESGKTDIPLNIIKEGNINTYKITFSCDEPLILKLTITSNTEDREYTRVITNMSHHLIEPAKKDGHSIAIPVTNQILTNLDHSSLTEIIRRSKKVAGIAVLNDTYGNSKIWLGNTVTKQLINLREFNIVAGTQIAGKIFLFNPKDSELRLYKPGFSLLSMPLKDFSAGQILTIDTSTIMRQAGGQFKAKILNNRIEMKPLYPTLNLIVKLEDIGITFFVHDSFIQKDGYYIFNGLDESLKYTLSLQDHTGKNIEKNIDQIPSEIHIFVDEELKRR